LRRKASAALDLLRKYGITTEAELKSRLGISDAPPEADSAPNTMPDEEPETTDESSGNVYGDAQDMYGNDMPDIPPGTPDPDGGDGATGGAGRSGQRGEQTPGRHEAAVRATVARTAALAAATPTAGWNQQRRARKAVARLGWRKTVHFLPRCSSQ
jgi:hypothetical protein